MALIADRQTPLATDRLLEALAVGYRRAMGIDPEAHCLACLGAQVCLETGNGAKMRGFNPGNRKLPKDWDGDYAQFKCDEIFDTATAEQARRLGPCVVQPWHAAKDGSARFRVVLLPPHPWSSFVAFRTAEEGMADYVGLLCRRFPTAWSRAFHGDADGFSRALHLGGYYTADEDAYTRGLVSIAERIRPMCERIASRDFPDMTDEERLGVESLVLLTLAQSLDTEPPPPEVA